MDAEDVTIVDKNKIVIKYDYNITGVDTAALQKTAILKR